MDSHHNIDIDIAITRHTWHCHGLGSLSLLMSGKGWSENVEEIVCCKNGKNGNAQLRFLFPSHILILLMGKQAMSQQRTAKSGFAQQEVSLSFEGVAEICKRVLSMKGLADACSGQDIKCYVESLQNHLAACVTLYGVLYSLLSVENACRSKKSV